MICKADFVLALVLASLTGGAAAEETLPVAIDEIQVTATRRAAATSDVAAALTIVPVEEISAGKLITDALAAEVGVFLQQTTPGQGAAIIRGLKGSEILHLVDGFRLNNAIFRNAPTQYLALVSPGTAARIEVVRGAPTSLYGSDAVGGVVQVLSRFPEFDGSGTRYRRDVFLAYDTAELGKILRASLDVGNQHLAGLISAEYLTTGDRQTGSGERITPSGYTSKAARVAVAATPDEEQSWLFDFQFARQPSTPRVDELVPGFGQTEPSSSEFFFAPNERQFAHIRYGHNDGLWSADWVIDAGWQRIVDDRITRNYQSPLRRHEFNQSDLFGITLSASSETDHGSWIVGAEIYHDRVASERVEQDISSGQAQQVPSRFPHGSSVDQAALYGQLLQRTGTRSVLSGGIRLSAIGVTLPETTVSPAASIDVNDLSADIGWIFSVSDTVQLVANIGHGFRAPNVFDMGTLGERPGNRFNLPNTSLQSERITQLDAGIRYRAARLQAEATVYQLHYTDRITSVLTSAITPDGRDIVQSRNVASADIRGIEAGIDFQATGRLTANAVLNYTFGEQAVGDGSTVAADRIPPLNGQAGLRYDATAALSVDASVWFAARQDRLSPRDVRDVRINPAGTAGWSTLNLHAMWHPSDLWTLSVGLDNLLDKQYRVHGSGIDAPGRSLSASVHVVW